MYLQLYQVQYEEASPSQPTNGQVGSAEFQVEPNTGFAVVSLESPARAAVVIPEEVAAAPPQTPQTPQVSKAWCDLECAHVLHGIDNVDDVTLNTLGWNKMASILQTFSSAFSRTKKEGLWL